MATISEVKWYQTGEGKCSVCGRVRPLGKVNMTNAYSQKELCIDCHFGPPIEYWTPCLKCGELMAGEICHNPQCESPAVEQEK